MISFRVLVQGDHLSSDLELTCYIGILTSDFFQRFNLLIKLKLFFFFEIHYADSSWAVR